MGKDGTEGSQRREPMQRTALRLAKLISADRGLVALATLFGVRRAAHTSAVAAQRPLCRRQCTGPQYPSRLTESLAANCYLRLALLHCCCRAIYPPSFTADYPPGTAVPLSWHFRITAECGHSHSGVSDLICLWAQALAAGAELAIPHYVSASIFAVAGAASPERFQHNLRMLMVRMVAPRDPHVEKPNPGQSSSGWSWFSRTGWLNKLLALLQTFSFGYAVLAGLRGVLFSILNTRLMESLRCVWSSQR